MDDIITRIFCDVHDFCKIYKAYCEDFLSESENEGIPDFPASCMNLSEVMTITILLHLLGYQCFKWYYKLSICGHLKEYFGVKYFRNNFIDHNPSMVSYSVEEEKRFQLVALILSG